MLCGWLCGTIDGHIVCCVSSIQELQHLKHSHVVQVHGLSVNSSIYIISEFLPKGPLDRYLQDNAASVRGGDLLSYAVQVAKVGGVPEHGARSGWGRGSGHRVYKSAMKCIV